MTEREAEARERLRAAVRELEGIRDRLREIAGSLPLSPQEQDAEDLDQEPDITTEVRGVILCVLRDSLDPAIGDLAAAGGYRPCPK